MDRKAAIAVLALCVGGCQRTETAGASKRAVCEPQQKFETAARAASGLSGSITVESAHPQHDPEEGDICVAVVWRDPPTPGGFRAVIMKPDGDVVRVIPGE